jgi:hypothetical protein
MEDTTIKMTIKVICSWCGCHLGSKQADNGVCPGIKHPISHSICDHCLEKELAKIQSATVQKIKRIS